MALQLKGSNGGGSNNRQLKSNNAAFGAGEIEETPEMKELRMKREADAAAAKEAIAKKQEEMRQKALVLEQMEAAKREREERMREEEEIRNNPALAAERERRLAAEKAAEEQRARFKAEEEAKIQAERRVQEKKMNQTDALIAAIRAQVEKEKAEKEASQQKTSVATPSKPASSSEGKPQYRTISPEEMAKLEEKKRMKAAGIKVEETPKEPEKTPEPVKTEEPKSVENPGVSGGISGGLGGLGSGPSLSNPSGDGLTLSNLNAGQQSLSGSTVQGGGLGIDITASLNTSNETSKADENTVALNVEEINAAVEKSMESPEIKTVETPVQPESVNVVPPTPAKPHVPVPEPVQVVGGASTIIVDDGNSWGGSSSIDEPEESAGISWVDSGTTPTQIHAQDAVKESKAQDSLVDANGDIISVVPIRQKPNTSNDVQSAYNIDFDDDDDDDDVMSFGMSSDEEAKRKAEEEARRQAEEAAKAAAQAMSNGFSLPVGAEQFLGKYLSVTAINDQIANTMKYISENPNEPRNIVILGQYGFGTTTIAEDFARSFYAMGLCKTKTIAKIKAGALNRANISDAISKLQGGCLVVENAGVISNEKLDEIYQIVNDPNNDVVVIMTGQIETLSRIFKDNVVISTQFKHLIQVHRITDMDVFTIAKNHAIQLGYPCEQVAENNLRRRMQEVESGNLDRVLKIVDNAVSKAHNREMTSGDQDHRLVPADFE